MGRKKKNKKGGEGQEQDKKGKSQGSSLNTFYVILAVMAVVGVGAVGWSVGSSALSNAVTEPVDLGDIGDQELVAMARGVERGNPDAPVTIVEFGDYQCPACGTFATQIEPLVKLNYVQSGQAKFVYYDFPLVRIHPNAFIAARAARCAGDQDAYWEFHDALFTNQSSWSTSSNPIGAFVNYAEELGLDEGTFRACVNSDSHADVVTANLRLAERLGAGGTPTIMVSSGDGAARRLPSFDYATIQQAVDAALESVQGGEAGDQQ